MSAKTGRFSYSEVRKYMVLDAIIPEKMSRNKQAKKGVGKGRVLSKRKSL